MKHTLLVVGCGFPQLGLLRAARDLGVTLVGLDLNPRAPGVRLLDRFVEASTADVDAIVDAVRTCSATALTTTGSELALTTTAAAAWRLDLPFYADLETVHRCQAKDAMRGAYVAAGLPVPRFFSTHRVEEAIARAAEMSLPVVVKPARGWGQRGVSRVDDLEGIARAFAAAAAVSHQDAGVVVEEHIVGRELSINGWVENDQLVAYAVTDREVFPGSAPLGVMRSEIAPSSASPADVDGAILAASRAARALGLSRGPCYTQVCVGPRGTYVFETAARCGGGFDADVTRLVSGVSLYRRVLGVALGDLDLERESITGDLSPAALVRFLAPPSGRVRDVSGVDVAMSMPGVLDAELYAQPGDDLPGLVNAASRVGHLLVVGATRAEAVARADEAEARLHVIV